MRSVNRSATSLAAAIVLVCGVAKAEEQEGRSYGGQILLADLASIGILAAGGAAEIDALSAAGAGSYVLLSPIIHFGHGEVGRGLGSLALRVALPIGGFYIGAAAAEGCDGFLCELGPAAGGMLIGMAAATLIDAAFLAREGSPPERSGIAFGIGVGPGKVTAGIGGRF